MHRAVRAVSNRLIVASHTVRTDGVFPAEGTEPPAVIMEDVQEALRHTAPAPWMAPPCQRAAAQSGAFSKFVV